MIAIALRGLASYAIDEAGARRRFRCWRKVFASWATSASTMIAAILCEFAAVLAADAKVRLAAQLLAGAEALYEELGAGERTRR